MGERKVKCGWDEELGSKGGKLCEDAHLRRTGW